jgi:hypothetical protein
MLVVEISPAGMDKYTLIRLAALYSGMASNVPTALEAVRR